MVLLGVLLLRQSNTVRRISLFWGLNFAAAAGG